ncbi:MAG: DNA methyltransferase, partial [Bacteroidales bacterium]|nr:DNA methyltransferase [Bacteroidales bacterium]
LLKTFDKIYILNLHGDQKKREVGVDGGVDTNVFDIQQGVSINIFLRRKKKRGNQLAKIFYFDMLGARNIKYDNLFENTINSIPWNRVEPEKPYFFFEPKNLKAISTYNSYINPKKMFLTYNCGIQTKNDKIAIQNNKENIVQVITDLSKENSQFFKEKYRLKDGVWKAEKAKYDIVQNGYNICRILYRPFDFRYTALTKKSGGFLGRPRYDTMKHFLKENIGLILNRQSIGDNFSYVGVSKTVICHGTFYLGNRGQDYLLPLYLYPDPEGIEKDGKRTPNLNTEIIKQIADNLNLQFTPEKEDTADTFAPIDILDYIYAVLHSPSYRETFKEFLKIDFPRIPYPKDQETFWRLVDLGSELRQIHLLESPIVENFITSYPKEGDNVITRKIVKKDFEIIDDEKQIGRVWINDEQYFDGIPVIAWEFYIGGYQPAQKWLKDRRGRELSFEDIQHYQKIIVALTETDRIMKEIDGVEFM